MARMPALSEKFEARLGFRVEGSEKFEAYLGFRVEGIHMMKLRSRRMESQQE